MISKKQKINFIILFALIYSILSIILLKTIATPLVELWEFLIKEIFKQTFNYNSFIFVPVCSGVISISIYLGIIFASKKAFNKKIDFKWVLGSVILIWLANLFRIILVLYAEKISLLFSKITHLAGWFVIGLFVIIYLTLKTIKKEKEKI